MFNLFKKNNSLEVGSPINGECVQLEEVNDSMFSQKMLGDGIAIIPSGNTFVSPCDGIISAFFPSLHAFGVTTNDGIEILVHIGLDTVNENGKGFTSTMVQGKKVKKGDVIVTADMDYLKQKYDMTTMIVVTNAKEKSIQERSVNQTVNSMDTLFVLK